MYESTGNGVYVLFGFCFWDRHCIDLETHNSNRNIKVKGLYLKVVKDYIKYFKYLHRLLHNINAECYAKEPFYVTMFS